VLYWHNPGQFKLSRGQLGPLVIIGICGVYLTNALEFWGLQFMESGRACFLYSFSPIITAVMSYLWLNERLNREKIVGLIIGILGFAPLLFNDPQVNTLNNPHFFISLGEWALLAAAVTTSVGLTYMRIAVKDKQVPALLGNGLSMCIGGACALGHSFFHDSWHPSPLIHADWHFVGWFALLTLVSNFLCYNLHAYLLRYFTATYIAFASLSCPFFAALFGWYFHREAMSHSFWLSLLIVSFGLYLYYREELSGPTPLA